LKIYSRSLLIFLIGVISCSANDSTKNNNQIDQALANINNQLAILEVQKSQVNQQYEACLASTQIPQMPCYGNDVDCTLVEGNFFLAQTAQMTTCGQAANYQLNQIEYTRSSLLQQWSILEQQRGVNSQPPATTNNPTLPTPALPPASTSPDYSQRAYEAHQRQLELIREQGNFNLRKDCNNSGGTWGGRNIGCY